MLFLKVEVILDKDQLWEEICFLKRTLKTKRRLVSLRADWGLQPSPVKSQAPYDHSSTKIILLMDWVRAVCDFYNLKVTFTCSFSLFLVWHDRRAWFRNDLPVTSQVFLT